MTSYTAAYSIVEALNNAGFIAYFAGGWVRDFLMNTPSDDIDIATSASVAEIQALFPKTIPVGIAFGIVIVVIDNHRYEVATFRSEKDYKDGRRPEHIQPTTPEHDAKRRDFTINGMFYDPLRKKLYDFVGGQEDLSKQIIRAIGNPNQRFLEDKLRMIRAVRYASRFSFTIEPKTLQAIPNHAQDLFPAVAIERIWDELSKMAAYPHFEASLMTLHQLTLLGMIFPELRDIDKEVLKQRLHYLPHFPNKAPTITKVFELFPATDLDTKISLCRYLKRSKKELQFTTFYQRSQDMFLSPETCDLYDWAHLYAQSHYQICLHIFAIHLPPAEQNAFLREHHEREKHLQVPIEKIQNNLPFITSEDLRREGVPNGKHMGILIHEGTRLAINKRLTTPREVINHLKVNNLWISNYY